MIVFACAIAFFVGALLLSWRSSKLGALLCVALLPWEGLSVDLGVRISAYMLAIMAFVPVVLLRKSSAASVIDSISFRAYHPFVAFAVVWSLLQIFFIPTVEVAGGILRSPVIRAVLQIAVLGMIMCPIWFIPAVFTRANDLMSAGRIYIASCFGLAVLGFLQVGIWYATGTDPLPIGILNQAVGGVNADLTKSGMVAFGGQVFCRMSSLGGEPKGLGQSLVIAIFLLQANFIYSKSPLTIRGVLAWSFLVLAVFATQSTSAFGTLAVAIVVCVFAEFLSNRRRQVRAGLATLATLGILFGVLCFGTIALGDRQVQRLGSWTTNALTERTIGRGTVFEDFDQAILGFLNDHPEHYWLGMGLGNIHLYADPYLPAVTRRYAAGRVFFAKSGYLKLISEVGIVGLVLFMFACVTVFVRLGGLARRELSGAEWPRLLPLLKLTFVFLCLAYLARVYTGGQFFIAAGGVVAACSIIVSRHALACRENADRNISLGRLQTAGIGRIASYSPESFRAGARQPAGASPKL